MGQKVKWVGVPLLSLGLLTPLPLAAHSLSEAIKLALLHNPDVLSAQHNIGVTTAQLDQAKADWLPTVDLAVDLGGEYKNKAGGDPTGLLKNTSSIVLNQPLFDGGATTAAVERSGQMQRVSAVEFDETRTDVALQAVEAWYELYKLEREIKLTEVNVKEHYKLYLQTKQKVIAGGAGRDELIAVETPWIVVKSALINLKGDYKDALARYQAVVGVVPTTKLMKGLQVTSEQLPATLDEAKTLLHSNSFILRSARANLEAARADHKGARAGLLPTLNFELKGGRKQNDAGIEGVDYDTTALLKLNYNLFRGGGDESRRRETARAMMDSQEQLALASRNMEEQLNQFWNGLGTSRKLLVTSHQQLSLAKENLVSSKEQFKLGEGDVKAIMAASDAVLAAKKTVLSDEIDVHIARYQLLAHLGLLLHHVQAADVVIVLEEMNDLDRNNMLWVDRLIGRTKGAPLLARTVQTRSAPVLPATAKAHQAEVVLESVPVIHEEGQAGDDWGLSVAQMKEAGWVGFNAAEKIDGKHRMEVVNEAARVTLIRNTPGANMTLVGGGAREDSGVYRRNRAQLRKLELQRRLGNYARQSTLYQQQLEKKQRRLQRVSQLVRGDQLSRRLALKGMISSQ